MQLSLESTIAGAFVVERAGAAWTFHQWSETSVRPGSREHVQTNRRGSPGTWEALISPCANLRDGVAGLPSSRLDAMNAHDGIESEIKVVCCDGIADRRKRSEARRGSGSRSVLILPMKRGNAPPERTPWREARRRDHGPLSGNTTDAQSSGNSVNGTAEDSEAGCWSVAGYVNSA